jgi:hypothetical protein
MNIYDYVIIIVVAGVSVIVLINSVQTYIDTRNSNIEDFNNKRISRKNKFDEY